MTTNLIVPVGPLRASICTDESLEVAAAWLNARHPTGIDSKWRLSDDEMFFSGEPNPCPCEHDPSRHHYLMSC